MKVILTGATGYIAKRLLPVLIDRGDEIMCCVRDKNRFSIPEQFKSHVNVYEIDFLVDDHKFPMIQEYDVAYYLIHSMSQSTEDFETLEARAASNFIKFAEHCKVTQVIYLSGIINESKLSKHLVSRKNVENILSGGRFALTTLRAGIIVGSGSASFEIIRDLVEKLPVMVTPKWLQTRSQPIAVRNVIQYLTGVALLKYSYGKSFDIGGPDILSYRDMLLKFAKVRDLKRLIFTIPVMTPRLSSYWLYFVTSTSYHLAVNLVDSMKVEIICQPNDLGKRLDIELLTYEEAIENAFLRIEQLDVISSWKDAMSSGVLNQSLSEFMQIPQYGCFRDARSMPTEDVEITLDKIWKIGGENGWYFGNILWSFRGFLDRLVGGVGLRRGRTNKDHIENGDALDFWRVLLADRENKRLLLFAEMKLPGEAWLEFKIDKDNVLHQIATFRPKGLWGRIYWYCVSPFHHIIFRGMIRQLVNLKS